MTPWRLDLTAQRWTPFVYLIQFPPGVDLASADVRAQVRLYPDQPGAPLVDLSEADATAQGLSISSDVNPDTSVATATLQIRINETTIERLPRPGEIADPIILAWDLHVTFPGIGKRRWVAGTFTVQPGVTQ